MIALVAVLAAAHPLAPAGVELHVDGTAASLTVRTRTALSVPPPDGCTRIPGPVGTDGGWTELSESWRCTEPLAGRTLTLNAATAVDVVATVHQGGRQTTTLLSGEAPSLALGTTPAAGASIALGARHLLGGADHILLVIGLLLLLGWRGPLLRAITAFTVGHSLTLALVAAGRVPVAQVWAEVAIAASLVWLALELLGSRSSLRQRPGGLCFAVGLLHGLGFAGAFVQFGVEPERLVPALAGFNLGIELAQLAILCAAAGILAVLPRHDLIRRTGPAWAMGSLAAAWMLERAWVALGG